MGFINIEGPPEPPELDPGAFAVGEGSPPFLGETPSHHTHRNNTGKRTLDAPTVRENSVYELKIIVTATSLFKHLL